MKHTANKNTHTHDYHRKVVIILTPAASTAVQVFIYWQLSIAIRDRLLPRLSRARGRAHLKEMCVNRIFPRDVFQFATGPKNEYFTAGVSLIVRPPLLLNLFSQPKAICYLNWLPSRRKSRIHWTRTDVSATRGCRQRVRIALSANPLANGKKMSNHSWKKSLDVVNRTYI